MILTDVLRAVRRVRLITLEIRIRLTETATDCRGVRQLRRLTISATVTRSSAATTKTAQFGRGNI